MNINDSSSIGPRALRPDKPVAQPVKRDDAPASGSAGDFQRSNSVAQSKLAADVTSVNDIVQANEDKKIKEETDAVTVGQSLNDDEKAKVEEALVKVKDFMQSSERTLNFEMAEEDNRVIITVIDEETNEVIRQIPPDDIVRLSDAIQNGDSLANGGILIHSKA